MFIKLIQQAIFDYLTSYPGSTKDGIYDAVVSCMDQKGQVEAHDFDALLRSVANEVQEPVKKNLFENEEPDLFGSHIQSRWYLKEAPDLLKQTEQVKKEDAERLEESIAAYLKTHPGEGGTLRRIKRFANALIDGIPVRQKDRPGNDRIILAWLRKCRQAGLYDQGKAIYDKGGLNLANLAEEEQIDAEDNYRICVRRGSSEKAKPKRQRRKMQDDVK